MPFITVNIGAPPTVHQACTIRDILGAAKALEDFALTFMVPQSPPPPPPPPPPPEGWEDRP